MEDKEFARQCMEMAYEEAEISRELGEVPVGAVMVHDGKVIARAHNLRESEDDPAGHAEMLVMKAAAEQLGTWNLSECTLVVTMEPCAMCTGALMQAHIGELLFGAFDMRGGCCGSVISLPEDPRLNAPPLKKIVGGFMDERAKKMMFEFFEERRKKNPPQLRRLTKL